MRVLLLITLIFGIGCILSECSYGASISPDVQGFSTQGFLSRKDKYLECCLNSDSFYAQSCRIIDPNVDVKKSVIQDALTTSYREDCSDFKMNKLFRIMYLDRKYPTFSDSIKQKAKEVILGFKYWFTEFDPDNPRNTMIFWTENHQLQFHTAELLAGQLYKNEIFTQSGMTGREHIEHASTLLNKWLDQRGKMGFAEWHSNIYFDENIAALVNLVDFAENEEIATKAAMILDLMAFDFANNYYKGVYATTHGRTEDENLIRREGTEGCHHLDDMGEAAWILLGLGHHCPEEDNRFSAVALATSIKYAPPAILEDIAKDAQDYHEHKGRNSINVAEGPEYGLDYEDDIIFWWGLSAPAAGKIIENSLELQKKCSLEPKLIFNEGKFVDALRHFAKMHGYSNLREYCRDEKALTYTLGPVLETVNTYTYRTPYYQLSGAQDHHKGMVGLQEQIWQATLEKEAVVSTNSPSKLKGGAEPKTSDQMFTGGWMPRATFYKNVGIIQYDRRAYYEEFDIVVGGEKGDWKYTHAYFPKWAFDRVEQHENRSGTWVLGKKEDSYLALYSNNPVTWESNYELRADGFENVWIVELGCADDNGSFEQFQSDIVNAYVEVTESSPADYDMYGDNDIYRVKYESPSLGTVEVSWDGCFEVDDKEIHLGPYPRFQNKYCYQKFGTRTDETGTSKTIIEYGSQSLELDFDNATRKYGNK